MNVRFFSSEELKFGTDVTQRVLNKDPDAHASVGGTGLSNSRWGPAAILFISSMRFGYLLPLDYNFSYNDATSFLYLIQNPFD